jgi:hypothetical protein
MFFLVVEFTSFSNSPPPPLFYVTYNFYAAVQLLVSAARSVTINLELAS